MHFAYPSRKISNPAAFVPRSSSRIPTGALRRRRTQLISLAGLAVLALLYFLLRPKKNPYAPTSHIPSGNPPVVVVTAFDESILDRNYIDLVEENRKAYTRKHGYAYWNPRVGEYDLHGAPFSWTKIVAIRDALTKYPDAKYIWYLDQDSFIMNPDINIPRDIMEASKLEAVMIKDHSVVPPDSIIKTYAHLNGKDVELLLSQDKQGLAISSFVIRNGEWATYLVETWFDPLYRSYNFQKAEAHALEHIVQWHPTILSKLGLVPQRMLCGYSTAGMGAKWEQGDAVVRLIGCIKGRSAACSAEAETWANVWRPLF